MVLVILLVIKVSLKAVRHLSDHHHDPIGDTTKTTAACAKAQSHVHKGTCSLHIKSTLFLTATFNYLPVGQLKEIYWRRWRLLQQGKVTVWWYVKSGDANERTC